MKKLFKQPKWLKPELNDITYYFHIAIIAILFLFIFSVLTSIQILSLWNFVISIPIIIIGDAIAHTVLQLD